MTTHREQIAGAIADRIIGEAVTHDLCHMLSERFAKAPRAHPGAHHHDLAALDRRLVPWEAKWAAMLRAEWEKERRTILANLKKVRKALIAKADIGHMIEQILHPTGVHGDAIAEAARSLLVKQIAEMGPQFVEEYGFGIEFNADVSGVIKWIENYVPKFSKNLEEVSLDDLRTALRAGIEAGEGMPLLAKRVNAIFDEYNATRAEMIARTETIRASNQAALEAFRQSGVVDYKIWIASDDACDECLELADMDPIPLDDEFTTTDYETVLAPPRHPACRCSLGSMSADQMDEMGYAQEEGE
jgi:SPP1 gp7 family putative phage head morphogenesis protein